ncbi:hypothetical protein [Inhella sp.]|uniref:hypothetical protein n=1 Tax=Inhella sp. TaxID=1921806 RepID=UPI0035B460ED
MKRRLLCAAGLLAGCASGPSERSVAQTAPAAAGAPPSGGRLWRLDAAASRLRFVVFRGGAAARLGHHHIAQTREASGWLWLPEQGQQGAQGRIEVPLAGLALDDPAWRREAGGEFDEKPVSEEDRVGTLRKLRLALQADAHPSVVLQLLELGGSPPWWVAEVRLQAGGGEARLRSALAVQAVDGGWHTQGLLALRHADLGLRPFSVLGGLLAVREELVLDFQLRWRRD